MSPAVTGAASPPAKLGTKRRRSPGTATASTSPASRKKRTTPTPGEAPSSGPRGKARAASAAATATPATADVTPPPSRTLIVDNGGDTIKYGWMTDDGPRILPNVTARLGHQFTTLVGDELGRVQNPNSLVGRTRSTERGVPCNLENQARVWKRMLDLLGVVISPTNDDGRRMGWGGTAPAGGGGGGGTGASRKGGGRTASASASTHPAAAGGSVPTVPAQTVAVILLLPPFCPRVVLDQIFHIWMDDFGASHVGLGVATVCASHDQIGRTQWRTSCTVDLGWSSTLVVPASREGGLVRPDAVRRLPLGGRHMVNMLRHYMSYRQYNLMDQEAVLRDVFERLSFVSLAMEQDLRVARLRPSGRRPYDRDFVLPDYQRTFRGEIRVPPALQRDLEREEERKKDQERRAGDGHEEEEDDGEDDDDDDDDDEDFVAEDAGDDDDGDGDQMDEDHDEGPPSETVATKKRRRSKKDRQEKSKPKGDEDEDDNGDDDDGDDDDDDEYESMAAKRERLVSQRADEERRRREQEEEEQVLRLSVERFAVPEVLFRPLDAGVQADLVGLAEAIVQSVEACPEPYRPALYRTVYLVGGVSLLPNLKERLERELRPLVPAEYEVEIAAAESPVDRAWFGARAFFQRSPYTKWSVSRKEWEEATRRKAYSKLLVESGGCYA